MIGKKDRSSDDASSTVAASFTVIDLAVFPRAFAAGDLLGFFLHWTDQFVVLFPTQMKRMGYCKTKVVQGEPANPRSQT